MCGICGISCKATESIYEMTKVINHRGPDFQDTMIFDCVAFGHTRLSIQDLRSAANQPMVSRSERYVIVFNGEIYNFQKIRKELESIGVVFKTNSDTEVLLEGYAYWKENILVKLNGMFAFSVYDRKLKTILVARDRFGIKPLYYYHDRQKFIFGSEIKSIIASKEVKTEINYQGLGEYLHYSTTLGEETFYAGIRKLLPGQYVKYEVGTGTIKASTFCHNYDINLVEHDFDSAINNVRDLFKKSVRSQLISDVPVGIFLSGGVDSAAITAVASENYNGKLDTFSAGFDFDRGVNELSNASYIARKFQTNHHELHIKGGDMPDQLEKLNYFFDQPFGDAANLPLFLLSGSVSGTSKVILQGDGGDEIFGGYHRYSRLNYYRAYKLLAKLIAPLSSNISRSSALYKRFRFFEALSQPVESREMAYIMSQEMYSQDPTTLFSEDFSLNLRLANPFKRYEYFNKVFNEKSMAERMLLTDANIILPDLYLEKVDRSTMANGIEVRVPFLDNELASYAMGLPFKYKVKGSNKKHILKHAFKGIVPDKILFGPKVGFGVPFQYWLKTSMKDFMYDEIGSCHGVFNNKIHRVMDDHVKGRADNGLILWKLLNLSLWLKKNKFT
jgi:asparagine synthase (glutamine-hydrolysing)